MIFFGFLTLKNIQHCQYLRQLQWNLPIGDASSHSRIFSIVSILDNCNGISQLEMQDPLGGSGCKGYMFPAQVYMPLIRCHLAGTVFGIFKALCPRQLQLTSDPVIRPSWVDASYWPVRDQQTPFMHGVPAPLCNISLPGDEDLIYH